jgi:glycosyltransferase involved in cell wall biosynthesis
MFSENEPYGQAFARELRKAEAAGYASFAGHLNACQLIDLLDEADAFVHFPTEEAFGLVVAEALARGLKFFGSNLGGIIDITAEIEGAELHDHIQSLKTGIINWIEAGALHPEGVSASIASRYHPHVIAQRHVEIYQEVLGKI